MAFVGNGFDIQVLADMNSPVRSDYASFYRFLQMRRFGDGNVLVNRMSQALEAGRSDWSDIEMAIEDCLDDHSVSPAQVEADLGMIQTEFSAFLNSVVSSDLLDRLSRDAQDNQWARSSLAAFLHDLPDEEALDAIAFPNATGHYHLFNFLFVNFNYTPLLDNYRYLDQAQFNPHPHRHADRNFGFYPNPRLFGAPIGESQTRWSSYINVEIVHPHGHQNIPRSILFGINDGSSRGAQRLSKPYWAQAKFRYSRYFTDADLFLIFGCSLGRTDAWWWGQIYARLRSREAELIIYWWNPACESLEQSDDVRTRFRESLDQKVADTEWASAKRRVHVIYYSDASERVWLSCVRGHRKWP